VLQPDALFEARSYTNNPERFAMMPSDQLQTFEAGMAGHCGAIAEASGGLGY
jgi:hypothetical protein